MSSSTKPASPDDVCGICLDSVVERGTLDCCKHLYCFECIKAWADKSSYCPLCKGRLKSIEARTPKDGRTKRNPAMYKIRKRHYKVNFNDTGLADAWRPEDFESPSEEDDDDDNHDNTRENTTNLFRGGRRRGRGGRIATTATNNGRRTTGISGNIGTARVPSTSTSATNRHRRTNTTTRSTRTSASSSTAATTSSTRRNTPNTLHIIDLMDDSDDNTITNPNDDTDDGSSVVSTTIDWLIDPSNILRHPTPTSTTTSTTSHSNHRLPPSPAQLIRSRRGRLHRLINYAEVDDPTHSLTVGNESDIEIHDNAVSLTSNTMTTTTTVPSSRSARSTANRRTNRRNAPSATVSSGIPTNGDYLIIDTNSNETEDDAIARLALYLAAQDNTTNATISSDTVLSSATNPAATAIESLTVTPTTESISTSSTTMIEPTKRSRKHQQQPSTTIDESETTTMMVPEDRGKLVWMKDHKGRWVRARLPPGSIVPRHDNHEPQNQNHTSSSSSSFVSSSTTTTVPIGSRKISTAAQALIDKATNDLENAAKQEKAAQAIEIETLTGNDPTLRRIYSLLSPLQSRSLASSTNIRHDKLTEDSPLKKKFHLDNKKPETSNGTNTVSTASSASSSLETDNLLSRLSNLLLRADRIQPLTVTDNDSRLVKETIQDIDNTEQQKRPNRK